MSTEDSVSTPGHEKAVSTGNGHQTDDLASVEQMMAAENITGAAAEAATFSDIVIFCHSRNVQNLVATFTTQIQHAAGALPLRIIWSGYSGLLHQGVIVLEWDGLVTREFTRQLAIDHEIFDFVMYDWTRQKEESVENAQQNVPATGSLAQLFVREER